MCSKPCKTLKEPSHFKLKSRFNRVKWPCGYRKGQHCLNNVWIELWEESDPSGQKQYMMTFRRAWNSLSRPKRSRNGHLSQFGRFSGQTNEIQVFFVFRCEMSIRLKNPWLKNEKFKMVCTKFCAILDNSSMARAEISARCTLNFFLSYEVPRVPTKFFLGS